MFILKELNAVEGEVWFRDYYDTVVGVLKIFYEY